MSQACRGTSSEVWEASYEEHRCALKLLKPSGTPEINFKHLRLFNNEIKVLSKLEHPNIYLAFEMAEKGDMFDYVSRIGNFAEAHARHYFKVLLNTLEYVHNQGYVHRNLKLENFLLTSEYQLKLAGLDNVQEDNTTNSYSAPEIYAKIPYSGIRTGLFSLGVVLFIMVTGRAPFNKAVIQDK
jgi:serine/threonine protein kinase